MLTQIRYFQEKKYKCELCDRGFTSKDGLGKHQSTHLDKYACPTCGRKLQDSYQLRVHVMANHQVGDVTRQFKCNFQGCKKEFLYQSNLKRHMDQAHTNKAPKYTCESCQKAFRDKWGLNRHVTKTECKLDV